MNYNKLTRNNEEDIDLIKQNLIRMLVERKLINKVNEKQKVNDIKKIKKDQFVIKTDNEENYNSKINNGEILIKIFNYHITSTAKGSEIQEFILKNINEYKILIIDEISEKSIKNLKSLSIENELGSLEIFTFFELFFIVIDNMLQPKFIPLNKEEEKQFLEEYPTVKKRDMQIILSTDPISKFYNLKTNNIVKIIRTTPVGLSYCYKVIL